MTQLEKFLKAANILLEEEAIANQKEIPDTYIIDEENRDVINKLIAYFTRDTLRCRYYGIEPHKDICLQGNVGSGKTFVMEVFRRLTMCYPKLSWAHFYESECRTIVEKFNATGYPSIERLKRNLYSPEGRFMHYLFNEFGYEPEGKHNGVKCNVMADILLDRYKLKLRHGIRTHLTTNLAGVEIEENYGDRLKSRMDQNYNYIELGVGINSKDRRKPIQNVAILTTK